MAERDGLEIEFECLRMRVTALERALEAAGIPIPPTPADLAAQAKAEERKMAAAASRNE